MTTPTRSLEQRRAALVTANRIRGYRAQLKRDLKAGRVHVTRILEDPPAEVATMKVIDLLLAAPKIGRVKAQKILKANQTSPSKTVGGLSRRQRTELMLDLGRPDGPRAVARHHAHAHHAHYTTQESHAA